MKKILTTILILCSLASFGQSVIPLRGDTIIVMKNGGNSNLKILNATRNLNGAYLRNVSGGHTDFHYVLDSVWVDGDSIKFRYGPTTMSVAAGSGGGPTYSAGYGLLLSSNTFKVDTNLISTRLWRQKGIDSINTYISANYYTKTNINAFFGGTSVISGYNKTQWDNMYASWAAAQALSPSGWATQSALVDTANAHRVLINSLIAGGGVGDMVKSTYDTDNDGIVDNTEQLGGQLPAYYQQALSGTGLVKSVSGTISYITDFSNDWNTAYSDRLKWDGGATGLNAATGRTSLGGTTVGQNFFTATNPSALGYYRTNADNTITHRTYAQLLSDIGALNTAAADLLYVPLARTLTINGTAYDLSANRSWTVTATPTLTSTYVGVGNGSNVLNGSSTLTYNGSVFYADGIINASSGFVGNWLRLSGSINTAGAPNTFDNPGVYYNLDSLKYGFYFPDIDAWRYTDFLTSGSSSSSDSFLPMDLTGLVDRDYLIVDVDGSDSTIIRETPDATPTNGSNKLITSDAVYDAIAAVSGGSAPSQEIVFGSGSGLSSSDKLLYNSGSNFMNWKATTASPYPYLLFTNTTTATDMANITADVSLGGFWFDYIGATGKISFRNAIGGGTEVFNLSGTNGNIYSKSLDDGTAVAKMVVATDGEFSLQSIPSGSAGTETVQEYTSSTSSAKTLSNTPIAGTVQADVNGILYRASNVSVVGTTVTLSGLTLISSDIVTIRYRH